MLFGTEQFFVVRIPDEDRKNPHFNPLVSAEDQFLEFSCKETCCEYDVRIVLMNAITVLKKLDKNEGVGGRHATLVNLSRLLQNSGGVGRKMIMEFSQIASQTKEEAKENADLASWFLNDYLSEKSHIFEKTSSVRAFLELMNHSVFGRMLNPDYNKGEVAQLSPTMQKPVYFIENSHFKLSPIDKKICDWLKFVL